MKPHTTPNLAVPPMPTWQVVPVAEPIPAPPAAALPVLEPVEPPQRPAALPVLDIVEPARRPAPLPVLTEIVTSDRSAGAVVPAPKKPKRDGLEWLDTAVGLCDVVTERTLGLVCMPLGLAVLASIPILNFIALGYLLEAGARIARSGEFRRGVFGIRRAGRVGGLILGIYLSILPVWAVTSMANSAELIDPTSDVTRQWQFGAVAATVAAFLHIALACLWGGKLRHFLLPILHPLFAVLAYRKGNPIGLARDGVWLCFTEARPWYFFWLGVRGAFGASVWLFVPITCLAVGWKFPVLGFLGFFLLLPVLVVLPFLQMNFARANRLYKMFDVLDVVRLYLRAPWACTFALFITLLFALPLYLFKIEFVPRDALFLPALVFIAFIWPARLLTGWVVGRAERKAQPSHWFFSLTGALPVPLFVVIYALFVWLSQYVSWDGVSSLYDQHPFLLPVPFTGM